jgi:hypothetical protein
MGLAAVPLCELGSGEDDTFELVPYEAVNEDISKYAQAKHIKHS